MKESKSKTDFRTVVVSEVGQEPQGNSPYLEIPVTPEKQEKIKINPMTLAPRCLAKTRRATLCQSPSIRGKKRCRIHGGAEGSGAPKGNRNALKDGEYTSEARARRKEEDKFFRKARTLFKKFLIPC